MDFKNEFIIELMECILSGADELQVKHMLDKETQNLQLQQIGVIKSVCEIEKEFEKCPLFKQYDNGCYGCKYRKQTVL